MSLTALHSGLLLCSLLLSLVSAQKGNEDDKSSSSSEITNSSTTDQPGSTIEGQSNGFKQTELFIDELTICDEDWYDSKVAVIVDPRDCCLALRTPLKNCNKNRCRYSYYLEFSEEVDVTEVHITGVDSDNSEVLIGSIELSLQTRVLESHSQLEEDSDYTLRINIPSELSSCVMWVDLNVRYVSESGQKSNNDDSNDNVTVILATTFGVLGFCCLLCCLAAQYKTGDFASKRCWDQHWEYVCGCIAGCCDGCDDE